MELKHNKQVRLTDKMLHDIDVYRASFIPPLTFSDATRALIEMALKTEKSNEDD